MGGSEAMTITVPRTGPAAVAAVDLDVRDVEERVARVADLVLKLTALAGRYAGLRASPDPVARQARIDALRTRAAQGRFLITATASQARVGPP